MDVVTTGTVYSVAAGPNALYVEIRSDDGRQRAIWLSATNYQIRRGDLIQLTTHAAYWSTHESMHPQGDVRRGREALEGIPLKLATLIP